MAKNSLVILGVVLGILGLLMIGQAYLAFSDASESLEEDTIVGDCETDSGLFCWVMPTGDFGLCSCLFGILLVAVFVPVVIFGIVSGTVGATLQSPTTVVMRNPLPPPAPPVGMVEDEFGDLERELDSLED